MTEEDIKRLQASGADALASTEKNILGNDLEKVWEYVATFDGREQGARIDFVLDNVRRSFLASSSLSF